MSGRVLRLGTGVRVVYDGDVVEVVELDGSRVTVRNDRTKRFTVVRLSTLIEDGQLEHQRPDQDMSI